jgi:hypothetical protein
MEKMLHRLETFSARGSDGQTYSVHAYEHLARVDVVPNLQAQWEPTGEAEYRLADGRPVKVGEDGSLSVADSGIRLDPETGH